MPSLLTLIASTDLLRDPDEREAFKQSQPGLRRGLEADASVELPAASDADPQRFRERRSHRHFSPGRVPLQRLGELLGCLRQWTQAGGPRYLYPSAGGLYPVQVYVHVKDGRVAGLDGGGYYYHPVDHRLVALSPGAALDRGIHEALTNRPIFDEAALSIFCVAQLDAVTPMYGENSLLFVTLETGYMSQLLMMTAAGCGIGLCPIGVLDFQPVRPLFRLEESQVLIHSFLGGLAPDDVPEPWSPVQEPYVQPGTSAPAREEGEV